MDAKTPTILPVSIQEVMKLVRRLFCALLALMLSAMTGSALAASAEIKAKERNEFAFDTKEMLIAHTGARSESAMTASGALAASAEIKAKGKNKFVFDTKEKLIAHTGARSESVLAFSARAEIKAEERSIFAFDTKKMLFAHSGIQTEPALSEALAAGRAFESLVRLHVIAENDSEIAQTRKLKVRDAVLECVREMLGDCENAESAWSILNERLGEIESAARIAAEANGFYGEIRAETGVFPFPDRDYGGVFVPEGDYRAVRIVIGAGEGKNWWCVLYPTLCVPPESAKRSVIAEWIRAIFGLEESR